MFILFILVDYCSDFILDLCLYLCKLVWCLVRSLFSLEGCLIDELEVKIFVEILDSDGTLMLGVSDIYLSLFFGNKLENMDLLISLKISLFFLDFELLLVFSLDVFKSLDFVKSAVAVNLDWLRVFKLDVSVDDFSDLFFDFREFLNLNWFKFLRKV